MNIRLALAVGAVSAIATTITMGVASWAGWSGIVAALIVVAAGATLTVVVVQWAGGAAKRLGRRTPEPVAEPPSSEPTPWPTQPNPHLY